MMTGSRNVPSHEYSVRGLKHIIVSSYLYSSSKRASGLPVWVRSATRAMQIDSRYAKQPGQHLDHYFLFDIRTIVLTA